jgi:hypothetical protein
MNIEYVCFVRSKPFEFGFVNAYYDKVESISYGSSCHGRSTSFDQP